MGKDVEIFRTEELIKFLQELAAEYERKSAAISLNKQDALEKLSDWERKLASVNEFYADNSNLFSPHNKSYDMEEVKQGINEVKSQLDELNREEEKLLYNINYLKGAANSIDKRNKPQNDLGLNILESQEKDRQRIARDLHDSTVQNLTGIVHKIELCLRLVDLDPLRAKLELTVMANTVKSVINEIREIIYNLKPMSLDDLGFVVTVERYTKQLMMSHNIKVYFQYEQERDDIHPVVKLSLFRVIQEACHNVLKHANATRIDIGVKFDTDFIRVSIKDDGKGFDTEKQMDRLPERTSGYGLSIMKERIYLLSGTMKIFSEINKGTIITITVPLTIYKGEKNEQTD